jgi:uncharacterized HhH-GPD family protein
MSDATIARELLNLRELAEEPMEMDERVQQFTDENSNAWLFGVIFDQQVEAELAWGAPYKLKQRLGTFSMRSISRMPLSKIQRAMKGKSPEKALHRYVHKMAVWLKDAARKLVEEYGGQAENIWSDCRTAGEVIARLSEFKGISQKKAHMAAATIASWERFDGLDAINVAVDVHVKRVWRRLRLVSTGATAEILRTARRLHPQYPGALDAPTWQIGRRWCHAGRPDCSGTDAGDPCPLAKLCPSRGKSRGRRNGSNASRTR